MWKWLTLILGGQHNMGKKRNKNRYKNRNKDFPLLTEQDWKNVRDNQKAVSSYVPQQPELKVNSVFCHKGTPKVMVIGNTIIYAGAFKDVRGDWDWDVMLRLSDGDFTAYLPIAQVAMNEEAKALLPESMHKEVDNPAIIDVLWPDFEVPSLNKKWWMELVKTIKSWPAASMLVHCLGGHGRTGTALAILGAMGGVPEAQENPVEYVRSIYCKDAIESMAQINYIKRITGKQFQAEASTWRHWNYGTPASQNSSVSYARTDTVKSGSDLTSTQQKALEGDQIEAEWQDNGITFYYSKGKVWRKTPDDTLVEEDLDDGSYYGSNHRYREAM
jgi:protein-tyrosine phosphatase